MGHSCTCTLSLHPKKIHISLLMTKPRCVKCGEHNIVLWHEDKCVCCRMQIKQFCDAALKNKLLSFFVSSVSRCRSWRNHPGCSWSLNKKSVQFHCFSWCLLLNRPDGHWRGFLGFIKLDAGLTQFPDCDQYGFLFLSWLQLLCVAGMNQYGRTGGWDFRRLVNPKYPKPLEGVQVDSLLAQQSLECTDSMSLIGHVCSRVWCSICTFVELSWRFSLACWSCSWRTSTLTSHLWLQNKPPEQFSSPSGSSRHPH